MSRHTYDTDIEIAGLTVPVDGATVEADRAVLWCLRASDDLHDELVGYAIEQSQPDPDAAYDAARDAAMEAGR